MPLFASRYSSIYLVFFLAVVLPCLRPGIVCGQTEPLLYARHPLAAAETPGDIQADIDLYHAQIKNNVYGDIQSHKKEQLLATPLDTFIEQYVKRGFDVLYDAASLFTLFDKDETPLKPEEQQVALDELYAGVRKYNSKKLKLFADHMTARLMDNTEYDAKSTCFEQVIREAKKAGDHYWVAYTTRELWFLNHYSERYARSFAYLRQLVEALDQADDGYPLKGLEYIWPGIAYYRFGNVEKALFYFSKGLSYRKPADKYLGGNYLRAWSYLAAYHHEKGSLDSAAYYYRTIIASEESTVTYQSHLDFAICNLGRIEMEKGHYDNAIAALEAGLAHIEQDKESYEFICGVYISLGECYLAKGDIQTAGYYIDKSRHSIPTRRERNKYNRLRALYALESHFYTRTGDHDKAVLYLDSALIASSRFERLTGQHLILLGEQELQEIEMNLKNQRIVRQKNMIVFILLMLTLTGIVMLIILHLYRRKKEAYRSLAVKAREWAKVPEPVSSVQSAEASCDELTEEDKVLAARLQDYLTEHKCYKDISLTLEILAEQMGISRHKLSRAINRTTGHNFNHYINEYRIQEAIRLLSDPAWQNRSLDECMEEAGFNSRTSFYQTFKKVTGLTPAQFRKNQR